MSSAQIERSPLDQKSIFARVSALVGARQDGEVAKALGVTAQNFATWKSRGTIPFEKLCEFAQANRVSLDWLFWGVSAPAYDGVINVDLFNAIFEEIWRGAEHLGEYRVGPYLVANACSIYNEVAVMPEGPEQAGTLSKRVHAALSSLAHASAALLKRQEAGGAKTSPETKAEIARLELLAKWYDRST